MDIDQNQFKPIFIEESLEALDSIEGILKKTTDTKIDKEDVNTLFRNFHSIKGGSGVFGLNQLYDITHIMESLLDEVRAEKIQIQQLHIDLITKTASFLRGSLEGLKQNLDATIDEPKELLKLLQDTLDGNAQETASNVAADAPSPSRTDEDDQADTNDKPSWNIKFIPKDSLFQGGNDPLGIVQELMTLGEFSAIAELDKLPDFNQLQSDKCYCSWQFTLKSDASKADLEECFAWVMFDVDTLEVTESNLAQAACPANTTEVESESEPELESEPENIEQQTPEPADSGRAPEVAVPTETVDKVVKKDTPKPKAQTKGAATKNLDTSTIRVSTVKIDALLNIVSELVITQSLLTQMTDDLDDERSAKLKDGLAILNQNSRELQKSVMDIRMVPISVAFNRVPRMIFDLSNSLGKEVDLQVTGEGTEVDKTILEKLNDPLTHIIRNSIDHGIESPEERVANGKPAKGVVKLKAYHASGDICIEVTDDGKGLSPTVLKNKAIEKGLIAEGEILTNNQCYELIFHPGFSTAAVVSDISGRGVGMEVVKKNIEALGGKIEIHSKEGVGTTFQIVLPLTLAILDVQLVRTGNQKFIIPISSMIESMCVESTKVKTIGGRSKFYRLRDESVPMIRLDRVFKNIIYEHKERDHILVMIQHNKQVFGLVVDELLSQQQIVIKSLEENYKKIDGIAAATILGDGTVSFILDLDKLYHMAVDKATIELSPKDSNLA